MRVVGQGTNRRPSRAPLCRSPHPLVGHAARIAAFHVTFAALVIELHFISFLTLKPALLSLSRHGRSGARERGKAEALVSRRGSAVTARRLNGVQDQGQEGRRGYLCSSLSRSVMKVGGVHSVHDMAQGVRLLLDARSPSRKSRSGSSRTAWTCRLFAR
jgi:hypothetical protein